MSNITYKNAHQEPFLQLLRELVRSYQAVTLYDVAGLRKFDLTQAQADVVFTLGNTDGMTFKEIGEMTLITKGTLTGVIDRLESKGVVQRLQGSEDRRCVQVRLTQSGVSLFQDVFPKHISYMKERFNCLSDDERVQLISLLKKLKLNH